MQHFACCLYLLPSPVIPTGTQSIFEMMEMVYIPHNNFPSDNIGDELGGSVAVTTNMKVLGNLDECPRTSVKNPKSNGKPLTMAEESKFIPLHFHIIAEDKPWNVLLQTHHKMHQLLVINRASNKAIRTSKA
eukprot:Gb_23125 [translate_table: standard]